MRSIWESCGQEIREAAGGDPVREALLAAIAANESGGRRQAYRFAPEIYERLKGLLNGSESKVDGLTKAQLEKRLAGAKSEADRDEILKKLAGLHGYTQIAGYCSVVWKTTLEALSDKATHFQLAAKRVEELWQKGTSDPERRALEVGQRWSMGPRSSLYGWRLETRMALYREFAAAGNPPTSE